VGTGVTWEPKRRKTKRSDQKDQKGAGGGERKTPGPYWVVLWDGTRQEQTCFTHKKKKGRGDRTTKKLRLPVVKPKGGKTRHSKKTEGQRKPRVFFFPGKNCRSLE